MSLLDRITGHIIRLGAVALAAGRIRIHAAGLEHIPAAGPVLLVARHYHHLFDGVVLLVSIPRRAHILVTLDWAEKKPVRFFMTLATTAAKWPVVLRGTASRASGDPGPGASRATTHSDVMRRQRKALDDAVRLLAQGALLVVFPEGYPNIDPHYTPKTNPEEMLPFRAGFATIAAVAEKRLKTNVAIVPIGLAYAKENRRWTARLHAGEAIYLKDFASRQSLVRYLEQRIAELSLVKKPGPAETSRLKEAGK